MQVPFFDLNRQNQLLASEYHDFLSRFLDRSHMILGEEVDAFEREFAEYIGTRYCVSCGNATDALEMLLSFYQIGEGDEVIVPAFGWISLVSAVSGAGATPVFVDVGWDGNIDVAGVQKSISVHTKAVIGIHLYGNPLGIEGLLNICELNKIILIEDCAQAHGAEVHQKKVGNFGNAAVFSFYPTKNLGAMGDAGAILTNNAQMAVELKMMRDYGRSDRKKFVRTGRNSRMDELQAGFLRLKLRHLDLWNKQRREIADQYDSVLGKSFQSTGSVYYKYVFRVKDREKVINVLNEAGIATDIYYPFVMSEPGYFSKPAHEFTISTALSEEVLSLPLFPELSNEEITYICDQLPRIEKYIL